jgi:NADPH:quinone reductase-like Zn-dependent oxidoreductase
MAGFGSASIHGADIDNRFPMARMRAVVVRRFGGPDVLTVEEVARPAPLPTEVLVRVHAAGVNPVDRSTREGRGVASVIGEPPFIPGWDVSGVVEATGYGVTRFAEGDEVFGLIRFPHAGGAYAEYATAPSRHLARKPSVLTHVEAAAMPLAALTAWQALVDTARIEAGQTVLIHAAAGGVGHFAVQIGRAYEARVIGTARAEKHAFLRELGADEVVDYTAGPFEESIGDVDVVLDLVGDDYSPRSFDVLRPGGLLISAASFIDPELPRLAASRGRRATGMLVEPDYAALERLCALVDEGRLRPVVERVFPLEEVATAHDLGQQGRTQGKLVLRVGG